MQSVTGFLCCLCAALQGDTPLHTSHQLPGCDPTSLAAVDNAENEQRGAILQAVQQLTDGRTDHTCPSSTPSPASSEEMHTEFPEDLPASGNDAEVNSVAAADTGKYGY